MKTTKDYLYEYLGRPEDYEFDIDEYTGPYGGLINIMGLRHRNIVIAGNNLYRQVCEHFDTKLDRWEFLHELGLWSAAYVKRGTIHIGKQTITRGQLEWKPTRYYCVPSEALAQYEAETQVAN